MFVPLKLMFPQADIPCLQLSLVRCLDPQVHLAIGQALQTLDLHGKGSISATLRAEWHRYRCSQLWPASWREWRSR